MKSRRVMLGGRIADERTVTLWFVIFLMQDGRVQADRIRAAMEGSLARQRASVRLQAASAGVSKGLGSRSWTAAAVPSAVCEAIAQPELVRMIDETAQRQNVDPALVREVARQESGFRPCAVSPMGAEGLMQLMPATQVQLQVENPFSAQQSIEAGSKLLRTLLDRYDGDLSLALSAYNAGPEKVDKAGGVPAIPETRNYVNEILNRLLPATEESPNLSWPPISTDEPNMAGRPATLEH